MSRKQAGMTLAEVLVAVGIVGVLIFATSTVMNSAYRLSRHNEDKQFATQKAIAMLEELKAIVEVTNGSSIVLLDGYDDAGLYRNVLTTQGNVLTDDPASPTSGNRRIGAGWLYSRQISVLRTAVNDVRIVRVRVYRNEETGAQTLAAEVAGVLRTLAVTFPPTEVYDVYCVAIENVPGWWVNLESLQPFVQTALSNLQARNPGLEFRSQFITKLSYGRDREYKPYINATTPSTNPINSVYFYPGRMPTNYTLLSGAAASSPINAYYPWQGFAGRMQTETSTINDYSATTNPFPYALADQYNHAMRYEDEKALYDARRTATDGGTPPALLYPNEAPTLRLLLDDMVLNPNKYQNAIVLNVHGELFPFPPVRNFSDPAKDPESHPGWRVVTHPEEIASLNTDPSINLRVYSYLTSPRDPVTPANPFPAASTADIMNVPITIVLKGINWAPTAGQIRAVTGGYDFDNNAALDPYSVINAFTSEDPAVGRRRMYYTVTSGTDTIIKLYNSPLRSKCFPADCSQGGLDPLKRLYGLEYIPAPLENFGSTTAVTPFTRNLVTPDINTKNTARWLISIPAAVLPNNSVLKFQTRIGDQTTSG
ncbi:MAG: prepilin-type N-terminal cleavage/methylation domain-containing protein, partial [Acidobacteriota bacterium]